MDHELTKSEESWMNSILDSNNLTRQRTLGFIFMGLSIVILFLPLLLQGQRIDFMYMLPVAVLVFYIGVTRYAFYKLYRIIQYLGNKDKK